MLCLKSLTMVALPPWTPAPTGEAKKVPSEMVEESFVQKCQKGIRKVLKYRPQLEASGFGIFNNKLVIIKKDISLANVILSSKGACLAILHFGDKNNLSQFQPRTLTTW